MLLISRLPSGCTDVATTLTVRTGEGTKFAPTAGEYRWCILHDPAGSVADEHVAISGSDANTITVARAQRRTTAAAFPAEAWVFAGSSAADFDDIEEAVIEITNATAAGLALLDDATATDQRGTLGLDTDDTVQFARLGINTTPTGTSVFQVLCDGVTTDIPIFGKVDQVSDNIFTGLRLLSIRDGNMGDGFGSSLVLAIQDDSGVLNLIGQVGAVRDGADDTGKLVFRTAIGGTLGSRLEVDGDTTSVLGNLSVDAGATMYADATANRVGFGGKTSPEGAIHTSLSSGTELPVFERIGDSNNVFACGRVVCTKATDMGDGFGPAWYFYIRDDAGVLNLIGGVGACRAGADNTGHVTIYTVTAGATRAERMRVMNTGTVGIGTTTDGLTAGGSLNVAQDIKAGVRFGLGLTPIARRAHVADPAGGTTVDAEARTAINAILATLEAYGFHATS